MRRLRITWSPLRLASLTAASATATTATALSAERPQHQHRQLSSNTPYHWRRAQSAVASVPKANTRHRSSSSSNSAAAAESLPEIVFDVADAAVGAATSVVSDPNAKSSAPQRRTATTTTAAAPSRQRRKQRQRQRQGENGQDDASSWQLPPTSFLFSGTDLPPPQLSGEESATFSPHASSPEARRAAAAAAVVAAEAIKSEEAKSATKSQKNPRKRNNTSRTQTQKSGAARETKKAATTPQKKSRKKKTTTAAAAAPKGRAKKARSSAADVSAALALSQLLGLDQDPATGAPAASRFTKASKKPSKRKARAARKSTSGTSTNSSGSNDNSVSSEEAATPALSNPNVSPPPAKGDWRKPPPRRSSTNLNQNQPSSSSPSRALFQPQEHHHHHQQQQQTAYAEAPPSPTAQTVAAYTALFDTSFVNPFNGRLTEVGAPLARALFSIGFERDEANPLHIRWRPELFFRTFLSKMRQMQAVEQRRRQRQRAVDAAGEGRAVPEAAKRGRKPSSSAAKMAVANADALSKLIADNIKDIAGGALPSANAGAGQPKKKGRKGGRAGAAADAADGLVPSSAVMAALLKPFAKPSRRSVPLQAVGRHRHLTHTMRPALPPPDDGSPPADDPAAAASPSALPPDGGTSGALPSTLALPSWRAELVSLMLRPDMLTAVPQEVARRYEALAHAFLPPKLDAAPEPADPGTRLTADQQHVLQLALRGHHLFIGGSAGTGKTVLLKAIHRCLADGGLRVAVTATTGVAAVQLGGCTFHHAFGAPVGTADRAGTLGAPALTAARVRSTRRRWDGGALRAVDVIIIDEVSLLDAQLLDALDFEARLARTSFEPFGGIQVITCGDFLQLSIGDEESLPVYAAAVFRHFVQLRLVTPMRHAAGDPLLQLLDSLRHGRFDSETFRRLDRPLPRALPGSGGGDGELDPSTAAAAAPLSSGPRPGAPAITYIFPRRLEAKQLNDARLDELVTPETLFTPARGALQLCGSFTPSAHIVRDSPEPFPPREDVVRVVQQELARVCPHLGLLADHDCVVMPANTPLPSLLLRLRFRDRLSAVPADRVGSAVLDDPAAPPPAAAALLAADSSAAASPDEATAATEGMPAPARLADAQFVSQAEWEAVAAAVAARLGGGAELACLYEQEPAHLVPLSVSMALADMTRMDTVEALKPLRLKLGCRVMVNRNLSRTVSNGSVGVVEAFMAPDPALFPRRSGATPQRAHSALIDASAFETLPVVRLLSGEVVQIPPIPLVVGGTVESYYYSHEVRALPLQLGYAFTVHKVQGLTLQGTVVLDCRHFFDCPHLIYVACSRVRSIDQLVVRNVEAKMVIVKRSALEFSEALAPASDPAVLSAPPSLPRAAWAANVARRVFSAGEYAHPNSSGGGAAGQAAAAHRWK